MYDNLAHLAALAHEAEIRRSAASPERQFELEARRTRCRRLLRRVPCPQTA
jgi:hypothetical protein